MTSHITAAGFIRRNGDNQNHCFCGERRQVLLRENMTQDNTVGMDGTAGDGGQPRKYPASTPQVSLVPAEMYHALVVAHKAIASLRLTDAEREAVEWAEEIAGNCEEFDRVATLRGLLERFKCA